MIEEEASDEKQVPTPGIDYVVTIEQMQLKAVKQTLDELVSVDCQDVNKALNSLAGELAGEELSTVRLFSDVTGYHFAPDHPTEPFKPRFMMGGRRSLVPTDLLKEQVDVFAEFAPKVTHLGQRWS